MLPPAAQKRLQGQGHDDRYITRGAHGPIVGQPLLRDRLDPGAARVEIGAAGEGDDDQRERITVTSTGPSAPVPKILVRP